MMKEIKRINKKLFEDWERKMFERNKETETKEKYEQINKMKEKKNEKEEKKLSIKE